jgi:hypothetical protein
MKEKVLKEYRDLEQKIGRLKKFIHDKNNESVVGETQWALLQLQLPAMMNYLVVLDERLKDFGVKH